MRQLWWKAGGIVILFYVLIVSLLTPLSPGVVQLSQTTLSPGETTVEITGYNTHFSEGKALQVWLTNGSESFCATSVVAESDTRVRATFEVDSRLQKPFFHLQLNNTKDGTLFYPEAFYARNFEYLSEGETPAQTATSCVQPVETETHGFFTFPNRSILNETIRNLMFHVPMWFVMFFLMAISVVQGVRYLGNGNVVHDMKAEQSVRAGLLFAVLGLVTGSVWARFAWGAWWVSDPQLNGAAVTFLMYVAYLILRNSLDDEEKRARVSAVYNIFAFAMLVVLILILPRFTDSLHPGKGGNPAFSQYDLDSRLRLVFYPAVVGWIILGYWIYTLRYRMAQLKHNAES
jgi:heme exporter protein C